MYISADGTVRKHQDASHQRFNQHWPITVVMEPAFSPMHAMMMAHTIMHRFVPVTFQASVRRIRITLFEAVSSLMEKASRLCL